MKDQSQSPECRASGPRPCLRPRDKGESTWSLSLDISSSLSSDVTPIPAVPHHTGGRGLHPEGSSHFLFPLQPPPSPPPRSSSSGQSQGVPRPASPGASGPSLAGSQVEFCALSEKMALRFFWYAVRLTEPGPDGVIGLMAEPSPAGYAQSPGQVNTGGFGLLATESGFDSGLDSKLSLNTCPRG